MSTKEEALNQLIERARKDPQFFHALVFSPEKVLGELDFLDRRERGAIVAIRPEDVIAGLAGLLKNPTSGVAVCGYSCSDSCDITCGEGSCFGTCYSSCDHTCGARSCDITAQIFLPAEVSQPLAGLRGNFRSRRRF
jgi:hypothetical protein